MTRAANRLDMAVQDRQRTGARARARPRLPAARRLAAAWHLTEAGVEGAAPGRADLPARRDPARARAPGSAGPSMRLAVGIADGLAKLEVQRLLQPLLATPDLRLVCHEGEMAELLAELALHQLDVVLSDHPAPFNPHLKVHSHSLGTTGMGWYATPHWWQQASADFPASLQQVPLLLPTSHSIVRGHLDQWLAQQGLRPARGGRVRGQRAARDLRRRRTRRLPAALALEDALRQRHQARLLGACTGVAEHYYAISTERKVQHPLLRQLLPA